MRRPAILLVLAACTASPRATHKQSGFVSLTTWHYDSTSFQVGEVFARFYSTEFPEIVSTSDPCELDRYDGTIPDDAFDAGLITVSGTHPAITLMPDASGRYTQFDEQSQTLFDGGEALEIIARGSS